MTSQPTLSDELDALDALDEADGSPRAGEESGFEAHTDGDAQYHLTQEQMTEEVSRPRMRRTAPTLCVVRRIYLACVGGLRAPEKWISEL